MSEVQSVVNDFLHQQNLQVHRVWHLWQHRNNIYSFLKNTRTFVKSCISQFIDLRRFSLISNFLEQLQSLYYLKHIICKMSFYILIFPIAVHCYPVLTKKMTRNHFTLK
jgi:hypothetical protein